MSDAPFHFDGFVAPSYTPVPDEVFDELMPHLGEAELKVLLYVIRRTFGFKRQSDAISLKQMTEGITTRDGRVLDRGTGLSRPSVTKGVRGLVEKGVLIAERHTSADKGDLPTTYRLRFQTAPGGGKAPYEGGGNQVTTPVVTETVDPRKNLDPQETVKQQTVQQQDARETKDDDATTTSDAASRVWTASELLASEDAWERHRRYVANRLGGRPGPREPSGHRHRQS